MKRWVPFPVSWASDVNWHSLTPRARVLLHCGWQRSTDGSLPTDPKALQIMAGVPDRPSRVLAAAEELEAKGFLERAEGRFFLAQWRKIFAKFGAKSGQNSRNSRRKNQEIPHTSAPRSRARTLSLKEIEKERERQTPSGPSAVSHDELEQLRKRLS